jgi:hypothetical protein
MKISDSWPWFMEGLPYRIKKIIETIFLKIKKNAHWKIKNNLIQKNYFIELWCFYNNYSLLCIKFQFSHYKINFKIQIPIVIYFLQCKLCKIHVIVDMACIFFRFLAKK